MQNLLTTLFWWIAKLLGCTYFIQPNGRGELTYYEKGRRVTVETAYVPDPNQPPVRFRDFFDRHFEGSGETWVWPHDTVRWDPPHDDELIPEEKRAQILERLIADIKRKDTRNVRVLHDDALEARYREESEQKQIQRWVDGGYESDDKP